MENHCDFRTIRLSSSYFNKRKKTMYYRGRPERIKGGRYPITSEETPFMMLPLVKYAKDTNGVLFFIERGAYPQKISIGLLRDILDLDITSYSYQIANGKNDFRTINEELAEMMEGYIHAIHHRIINQKLNEEDIIELEKLWKSVKSKIQGKENSLNFLNNLQKYRGGYKINLLCALIKSESPNVLDSVKYSVVKNRANRKGSLNYRAKHSETNICIREEDFGNKVSTYRKEIFSYLVSKFPRGINRSNERYFFNEFNNFNRQFLIKHFGEVFFITLPLIRYLIKSMGIKFNNVIYCDDTIASGLSYFKIKLFHGIVGEGEFKFNIYTHMNNHVTLGETQLTIDTDFYEDIPEMFNFYYSHGERIRYKSKEVTKKEKDKYNNFVGYLKESINQSPGLINVLNKADSKTYFLARNLTSKPERYLSMLFFIIDSGFFNEESLRLFGHNSLVNYLEHAAEEQEEYGITGLLTEMRSKYKDIKNIRKEICMNILLKEHGKYLLKLKKFERFFQLYKSEVISYLNSEKIISRVFANSRDFIHLAKLFYDYIDSLNISDKNISYGY